MFCLKILNFWTNDKKQFFCFRILRGYPIPKSLAIVKVSGHLTANTEESRGNHLADTAAKSVALKQSQPLMEAPVLVADVIED